MSDRVGRNLQLARHFYEGWQGAAERGWVEFWAPEDIADGAVMWNAWGGDAPLADLPAKVPVSSMRYFHVMPDFTLSQFDAWPSTHGCAYRYQAGGHTADGVYHFSWESAYIWTDEAGRITRWEYYNDWISTPDLIKTALGLGGRDDEGGRNSRSGGPSPIGPGGGGRPAG